MRTKFITGLVLACTFALGVIVPSCSRSGAEDTKQPTNGSERPVDVAVRAVEPGTFQETIRVVGTIMADNDVVVPAEESGRLVAWEVPRGARVRKGQVIARLDDALLKAAFEAADAQYQLAELTVQKQEKVFEGQGISEIQMKSYQYQRDAAKAQMELAKARLEKTRIKSPIDGVLEARMVDAGEMVGAGSPVARVIEHSHLKISAGVSEKYAGGFRLGDPVTFTVDAYPGVTFRGKIVFIGGAVSKDSRSIPIEIAVAGADARLKPDMIASVTIALAPRHGVIVVREDYLQIVDRNRYAAFVAKGDRAEERDVRIGGRSDGEVLVLAGLEAGDLLITRGFQNVSDGQRIVVHRDK
ncbi:MAG: efflux RND transporter periplasmic adaptor subunit [Bacteroidota bacterium]|nr:efflux RND transporter periplasmic adaptor subunit [Bacteroidota bacterium]